MKFFLWLICFLTTVSYASAKPILDQATLSFLASKNLDSNQTLRVLIRSKTRQLKVSLKGEKLENYLIQQTQASEKLIFSQLKKQSQEIHPVSLWIVQGTIASLNAQALQKLAQNIHVASISTVSRPAHLVKEISAFKSQFYFDPSFNYTYGLEKIKVPMLNNKYPELTGQSVQVGIIDTGIDANHPDLRNKVLLFKDFISTKKTAYDDHGHGTHVAGTIAGGHASGEAIGIAPQAQLIIAKAFSSLGNSTDEGLLQSLQWMADPDGQPSTADFPKIISNSWNVEDNTFSTKDPLEEPFCAAIQNLNQLGIAVVFAAGNDGPQSSSVLVPGACPNAITVGATNETDQIVSFSSRGPTHWKSQSIVKPNISAPGEDIDSADTGGGYKTRSGTSMATPHIAGVLALLYQAKINMSVDEAKNYLYLGSKDLGAAGIDNVFGVGRTDVLNSVDLIKNNNR
jgi:subtilisin family serine protease